MISFIIRYRLILVTIFLGIFTLTLISLHSKKRKQESFFDDILIQVTVQFQKAVSFPVNAIASICNKYVFLMNLNKETTILRKNITALEGEVSLLKEAAIANKRLRKLLDFKDKVKIKMVPSEVTGKDPSNWFKTVLIDKGSKDGITRDMVVVSSEGIIGRIIEVSSGASKVLLLIDKRSAVDAVIQETRGRGILEGKGEENCLLKFVSHSDAVRVGFNVLASGLGGIYPKGLLLGKVSKIERREFEMFQYVEVLPSVNFNALEEVFIVAESPSSLEYIQ